MADQQPQQPQGGQQDALDKVSKGRDMVILYKHYADHRFLFLTGCQCYLGQIWSPPTR